MALAADMLSSGSSIETQQLGEELPLFCERCGYSFHGLHRVRCQHCDLLQFHCPECGHHQSINTLRPAAQRILGRLRAAGLVWIVFLKLNFFGWFLLFWLLLGYDWSRFEQPSRDSMIEGAIAFAIMSVIFAFFGRLLLLQWKRSWLVGLILVGLVEATLLAGEYWSLTDRYRYFGMGRIEPSVLLLGNQVYRYMMIWSAILIMLTSVSVWPIWVGFVRVLLSQNAAQVLLEWQKAQSDRAASRLAA